MTILNTPDDLVASLPALIGMMPADRSLILILLTPEAEIKRGMVIALDSPNIPAMIRTVNNPDHLNCSVIMVVISSVKDRVADTFKAVTDMLWVKVVSLFIIPEYEVGAPYTEMLSNYSGIVPDYKEAELTASHSFQGRNLNRTLADIAALYNPAEPACSPDPVASSEDILQRLVVLADAMYSNDPFDPGLLGGVLTHSPRARDCAFESIYVDPAKAHEIFAEAGRRLRGPARVEALTGAGLAAYVGREGIMARYAFNAAIETAGMCDPLYNPSMAIMADQLLSGGVHPDDIAQALFKNLLKEHNE